MNLPFAEAAEQNKAVILQAIRPYLRGSVLEIGSGTGQHAVYFASLVPELHWQTSDLESNLSGIRAWVDDSALDNLPPPLLLDALGAWPEREFDTIYSANSFHIMNSTAVAACIEACAKCLSAGGHLVVYGPFNYAGDFTSPSNARFDAMLKASGAGSGIKDFEWVDTLAESADMKLVADIEMPANNRILIWKKRTL
ncbi:class I SAM-dependent methyltransferase [Gammaproteobacteria bacterium]|nr:class I SAM-dependent methyltransferase [Gammaproteobacteria bacterium]